MVRGWLFTALTRLTAFVFPLVAATGTEALRPAVFVALKALCLSIVLLVVFTLAFTFFVFVEGILSCAVLAALGALATVFAAGFFDGADFLTEDFLSPAAVLAAAAAALRRLVSSAGRLSVLDFGLRVAACFARLVAGDFMVFLTDAITSALLFPVPLWRRDGLSTADKPSAVWKLHSTALERREAGCS
ncbi:MAG: hypothetical protein FWD08_04680 [Alphaproteobacteria bacterium]|nr:hypothetical protein [Alphaproteobacteria bacterium]